MTGFVDQRPREDSDYDRMRKEYGDRLAQGLRQEQEKADTAHGNLDPYTFLPERLPTGRMGPAVQHMVNQAVLRYNRGLRESAANVLRGGLGTLQTYSRGGAASLASGLYGQLSDTLMRSQIESPDVLHYTRQDELMKRRKAARQSAYLNAGATIAAAAITAVVPALLPVTATAAAANLKGAGGSSVMEGSGGLGPTNYGPRVEQPSGGTPQPGGKPIDIMGGGYDASQAVGGVVGGTTGGAMGAGLGGPGPQAPQGPGGKPQSGGPGGPEEAQGGPGGQEQAQAVGPGGGMGGQPVDAFGMGGLKGPNLVSDTASAAGLDPLTFTATVVEADPQILEEMDFFLDGIETRLQALMGAGV